MKQSKKKNGKPGKSDYAKKVKAGQMYGLQRKMKTGNAIDQLTKSVK